MSESDRSRQSSGLLAYCVRPVPVGSAEYHVYRLEELFHTLHDLWTAGSKGAKAWRVAQKVVRQRWLIESRNNTDFLGSCLECGGRICNDAVSALGQRNCGHGRLASSVEEMIRLRQILTALQEMRETIPYQRTYPQEFETARKRLSKLLGRGERSNPRELATACFVTGCQITNQAIAALQAEARRHH